jgi:putative DNA methylase
MGKKQSTESTSLLFRGIDETKVHPVETVTIEQSEKYVLDTVDFSDPNRPMTCLEVDFPILKVNEIASIESSATKPVYMMSKWWARRRPSVFRQLLISAATKAPSKAEDAAQTSWSLMYRKSHQKHRKFSSLSVADIFMGGGTTVVEAARLGFKVTGVDLNPVAWWIVWNETHPVKSEAVQALCDRVQSIVKPQIMPFFTAKSPRGYKGEWIEVANNKKVEIDLYKVKPGDRSKYRWSGPEIVYTFWMKHIMCSDPACYHLTPQVNSSIVAHKTLKIKYYENCVCPKCGDIFDLEIGNFRMAPDSDFSMGKNEKLFATFDVEKPKTSCPHCKAKLDIEWISSQQAKKGKPKSKDVIHYLVLPKKWLKGISGKSKDHFGGYYGSSEEQDRRWLDERSKGLKLIEFRGNVPDEYENKNAGRRTGSDETDGAPSGWSGAIVCGGCGRTQVPLKSVKLSGHQPPVFPYLIQGFDPEAREHKHPYGGRFFALPDFDQIISSICEMKSRAELQEFVPKEEVPYGFLTHILQGGIPNHGFTHWYKMFNPRQLYVHTAILQAIDSAPESEYPNAVKSQIYGAFQNYLRHNCMFTIWNIGGDKLEPQFAHNNFAPKSTTVENAVFSDMGRGNFLSCVGNVIDGLNYLAAPYDSQIAAEDEGRKSVPISSDDRVLSANVSLHCRSSTNLKDVLPAASIDLVITDPPFGINVNYAEMADFFLVWLKRPLSKIFPDVFTSPESPKTLEAVTNPARHPGETETERSKADLMYYRLLKDCWKEAARILKPSGIMAFTFHHDDEQAWIDVLDSLFDSGFAIEAAFPVRSDSTKGEGRGAFGSKKIEYDIIHVCKKRLGPPEEVFWATLRKRIIQSVQDRALLLAQHHASGLHEADLEVVIKGEVLEQFSRHYGRVLKNINGDTVSVREILLEATSIAQSLLQSSAQVRMPDGIHPHSRVLMNLFRDGVALEYNAANKRLKGSGVSIDGLLDLGWVRVVKKDGSRIAEVIPAHERWASLSRKRSFTSDLDQAHFAINCCLGGRQLDGKAADLESWIEDNYKLIMPSVPAILKYIEGNHFGSDYKQAIGIAHRTLERTLQRIKETDGEFKKVSDQMNLFGD